MFEFERYISCHDNEGDKTQGFIPLSTNQGNCEQNKGKLAISVQDMAFCFYHPKCHCCQETLETSGNQILSLSSHHRWKVFQA